MVKLKTFALISLATASTVLAVPPWWKQFSIEHRHLSVAPYHSNSPATDLDLRLVQTSDDKAPFWTTEKQRLEFIRHNIGFMDVTKDLGVITTKHSTDSNSYQRNVQELPKNLTRQREFQKYEKDLSKEYMREILLEFTKFHNRYYKSQHGLEAAQWLYKKISDVIEGNSGANDDAKVDVSLRQFQHDWVQFSIIARFEGRDKKLSNAPIIIGAHLDSINAWSPLLGRAPGADDDGSGTALILDIFRVLINSKESFQPERPVEFHWYSAEEAGLLGSQDVAQSYRKNGVEVFAMLQNDQSGFVRFKDQEKIGLVLDYVDSDLTQLIKAYANEYTNLPVYEDICGYACSDHASWTKAGYRAALATEESFDDQCPYIHGEEDDLTHVDFDHMLQLAKLNLGFILELGNFKGDNDE